MHGERKKRERYCSSVFMAIKIIADNSIQDFASLAQIDTIRSTGSFVFFVFRHDTYTQIIHVRAVFSRTAKVSLS
jgi:hypothetical protein